MNTLNRYILSPQPIVSRACNVHSTHFSHFMKMLKLLRLSLRLSIKEEKLETISHIMQCHCDISERFSSSVCIFLAGSVVSVLHLARSPT